MDQNKEGMKFDAGKPRWTLLPWKQVEQIVEILTFGAKKYADNNWQKVENSRARYFDAMQRHLIAWFEGEKTDPESGKSHLAHAGCNLLFLMWFDDQNKGEK